jgi:hypothetical protein
MLYDISQHMVQIFVAAFCVFPSKHFIPPHFFFFFCLEAEAVHAVQQRLANVSESPRCRVDGFQ